MLTLLINETKPLAGLFASTTGGIGSVPDISVADEGQAVSVQTFTRTAGVITDSFVAGDVLHIGIGDGVNAPVCYIELSSASPATGTMAINTVGMVALFAATSANQLTLNVGVVRTRGGYTNTIFSAPIVIHRSVIDPDTAVPTPSILGTGVAAALLVAINTALGFVRLDASARYPALDGSQITNLAGGSLTVGTTAIASGTSGRILYDNAGVLGELPVGTGVATALAVNVGSAGAFLTSAVTSITGTANEITVTGTTTPTLSLPSALTFTSKTVTGGTFTGGAFNGTVGATTPSTIAGTTGTFSGTIATTQANGFISTAGANALIFTDGASAKIFTTGESSDIFTTGQFAKIYTTGVEASIYTTAANSPIYTVGAGSYIQTRSTFNLFDGTRTTAISHAPTDSRNIALPDASGTLALVSGDLGTPSALVGTNITGTAASLTAGNVTTNANLTGHVTSVGNAAVLGSFTMAQLSTAVSDGDPAYVGAANTFTTGQTISATTSLLLGTAGSAVGNIGFRNATSGTTTLAPATGALGTGTVTLPLSGTLATLEGSNTYTGTTNTFTLPTTTGTTTTSGIAVSGNSLTTGTGIYAASSTLTSGKLLDLRVSGTAAAASQTVLNIATTGANGTSGITTKGAVISNTHTGTTSTNTALELTASGGTTNYALNVTAGNIFIAPNNGAQILQVGYAGTGLSNAASNYLSLNANGSEIMRLHTSDGVECYRKLSTNSTLSVTGATTLTGLLTANGGITLGDAQNIAFNTTTGTKIGATTSQKLSFWNATPIVQPTTAVASATVAHTGGGTNIKTDDTFDGYTIAQVVKALRNAGLLA